LSLGQTIRAIKQRRAETNRSFGLLIGADASNISKYESGKVKPSSKLLVNLLRLAEGEERTAILQELGIEKPGDLQAPPAEINDAVDVFEQYLTAGGTGLGNLDASQKRFLEVAKLVAEGDIDPSITGILEKWVKFRSDRKARRFFKNLDIYLDVELRNKK
jgi:transcriptional regulator with XRE-family HTH domain